MEKERVVGQGGGVVGSGPRRWRRVYLVQGDGGTAVPAASREPGQGGDEWASVTFFLMVPSKAEMADG
jgi:hypothetical protein